MNCYEDATVYKEVDFKMETLSTSPIVNLQPSGPLKVRIVQCIVRDTRNKPGTAQVSAISKAQKFAKSLQSVKYSLLQNPREETIEKNRN